MSFVRELFSTPKVKKAEPAPTRDNAADAADAEDKRRRLAAAKSTGQTQTILTGPQGLMSMGNIGTKPLSGF